MDSKELGLVAAQQLLQVEDLHYGFWEKGATPSMQKLWEAQNQHSLFLIKHIEATLDADKTGKILDSGCGVGSTMKRLLEKQYRVDGLVPSKWMAQQAREKVRPHQTPTAGKIDQCRLEDFPTAPLTEKYRLVFFSESFQYVNMEKAFEVLHEILLPAGQVIIFDFFQKDGVAGKSPLKGGHSIGRFYERVEKAGYAIETDLDVTENLSPNLELIHDLLAERILPFLTTLDEFLATRYRLPYKGIKYLFRKKLHKLRYKYSTQRNGANFEKFKTYRLLVLKKSKPAS